jgi:hydroxyacyl-ACP dehydratase HTD2-like protein with hotdog domain
MNMINIMDFWRDTRKEGESQIPASLTYRATSPVYAEEPYRIVLEPEGNGKVKANIYGLDGTVCMKGEIKVWME